VLDLPGGGLGHAEAAAELDAGDALLALRQMVDRAEPEPQRQLGRGEDGAGGQRGLPPAGRALEQHPAGERAVLAFTTDRALELGLAETLLELHLVAGHDGDPRERLCVLGLH